MAVARNARPKEKLRLLRLEDKLAVPPDRLRWRFDPVELPFETTEAVESLQGTVGQERAVSALEFGMEIDSSGFNVFVSGPSGTGRSTTAHSYMKRAAESLPVPDDWVYVHNFADPYRPKAIRLPAGKGSELARDMEDMLEAARREIPRAFESEDYERRRNDVLTRLHQQQQAIYTQLQEIARDQGFSIELTPAGIITVPIVEGRPLSAEEYENLPSEQKANLEKKGDELRRQLEQALHEGRKLEKDATERLRQLEEEVALFAVGHLFEDLRHRYRDFPDVLDYLSKVQEDIPEHLDDFRVSPQQEQRLPGALAELQGASREEHLSRYKVNVVVDNSQTHGAPVIEEHNPTYYNLMGRLDYQARLGAMSTDFLQIKAGALHRANGGYLLVDALDVLTSPLAWDALKRTLETRELRIENIGEQYSPIPAATLRPEPIPLLCKVVMVGDPYIYYLLYHLDEDFRKLFKVKADFGPDMDRSDSHIQRYTWFISRQVREKGLRHFHRSGVAKMVEYGVRLVEDQSKLTTRLADIADMVVEASFWAGKNGHDLVMAEDVEKAIEHKEYRSNLIEEKIQEYIEDGTIMIDTEGVKDAQVNGLSVSDLGDYSFGRPSRITARTSLGGHGVVNIEREIKLSGPIHSKGVMILSGYLSGKYAQDYPLALSATLTFEQMYSEVDGDSASSTELYALLSALSGLPLKQGIAVTGSVNQKGEVQAVGGVTRKVEGFYEVCKAKGLTGEQGVIIPEANIKNLMLKDEVVQAVRDGKFHLWSVRTVDEGIELLTGVRAGEQLPDGTYPQGTVHQMVDARLREYAQKLKEFGGEMGKEAGVGKPRPEDQAAKNR
ncbi:MAG: Lon protease family protein [Chloroflexota bacterium]|jgi:lon-related putative ATP-dependent protease